MAHAGMVPCAEARCDELFPMVVGYFDFLRNMTSAATSTERPIADSSNCFGLMWMPKIIATVPYAALPPPAACGLSEVAHYSSLLRCQQKTMILAI